MRLKPPPGKRLVREWVGLRVRSRRTLTNGMHNIPKGTDFTVRDVGGGLKLETKRCERCNIGVYISRVSHDDVEVIQ